MKEFTCARSTKPIDEHQCCLLVLAAGTREELELCRTCSRGRALAELCPLYKWLAPEMPPVTSKPVPVLPKQKPVPPAPARTEPVPPAKPMLEPVVQPKQPAKEKPAQKPVVKREAPKLFPKLLPYVLKRYPTFKSHGFNFLQSVSQAQFEYTGSQEDMLKEAVALGLKVTVRGTRYTLVVDAAAKALAKPA